MSYKTMILLLIFGLVTGNQMATAGVSKNTRSVNVEEYDLGHKKKMMALPSPRKKQKSTEDSSAALAEKHHHNADLGGHRRGLQFQSSGIPRKESKGFRNFFEGLLHRLDHRLHLLITPPSYNREHLMRLLTQEEKKSHSR